MATPVAGPAARLGFRDGFRALGRGARLLTRYPSLVRWLAFPLAITLVLDLVAFYFGYGALSEKFQSWLPTDAGGFQSGVLGVVARAAAALVVVVALTFTFTVVYLTISGPFQEWMSREVEARSRGYAAPDPEGVGALLRGIWDGVRQALLLALAGLPIFVLGFIPLVGPVIMVAWQSIMLGYTFFEVGGNRRLMPFREKRALARRHLRAVAGMGLPMALAAFLPVLHLVFLPIYVAAGTLLFLDARGPKGDGST